MSSAAELLMRDHGIRPHNTPRSSPHSSGQHCGKDNAMHERHSIAVSLGKTTDEMDTGRLPGSQQVKIGWANRVSNVRIL
jgi:hypothetical protein